MPDSFSRVFSNEMVDLAHDDPTVAEEGFLFSVRVKFRQLPSLAIGSRVWYVYLREVGASP